jgi:hypothetical protein
LRSQKILPKKLIEKHYFFGDVVLLLSLKEMLAAK